MKPSKEEGLWLSQKSITILSADETDPFHAVSTLFEWIQKSIADACSWSFVASLLLILCAISRQLSFGMAKLAYPVFLSVDGVNPPMSTELCGKFNE